MTTQSKNPIPNVVLETERLARRWLQHLERGGGAAFREAVHEVTFFASGLVGASVDWRTKEPDEDPSVSECLLAAHIATEAIEWNHDPNNPGDPLDVLIGASGILIDGHDDLRDDLRNWIVKALHREGDTVEDDDDVWRACDEFLAELHGLLPDARPTLRMLAALFAPVTSTGRDARVALPAWFKPSSPAQTKALRAMSSARMVRGRVVHFEANDVVVFLEQPDARLVRTHIPQAGELLNRWDHFVMLGAPVAPGWYAALAAPFAMMGIDGDGHQEALNWLRSVDGQVWTIFAPWAAREPLRTLCATLVFTHGRALAKRVGRLVEVRYARTARGLPLTPVQAEFPVPDEVWAAFLERTQDDRLWVREDEALTYLTMVERPQNLDSEREFLAEVGHVMRHDDGVVKLVAEHPDFARELLGLLWPGGPLTESVRLEDSPDLPHLRPWTPEAPIEKTVDLTMTILTPDEKLQLRTKALAPPGPNEILPAHGVTLRELSGTLTGAVVAENRLREFEATVRSGPEWINADELRRQLGLVTIAELVQRAETDADVRAVLNRPRE